MHYLWLCPICLGIAVLFIAVERAERYIEADVLKGLASLVFVLLGWLGSWHASAQVDVTYARLILAGLAIGAVADVALNLRYVFDGAKGRIAFLVGILIFLLGHVAYLFAVARRVQMLPVFLVAGVVLTAGLMWWIFQRIEASMVFKVFGIFYIGAIVTMNCVALGAVIFNPGMHSVLFFVGALLFLISDIILILNTFGKQSRFSLRVSNLMLYYLGQLLIALSLQLL